MNARKWRQAVIAYMYLVPALVVIAFIYAYPLFSLFLSSFQKEAGKNTVFVGWTNYRYLLDNPLFWRSLRNNFILLLGIPITILLSLVFASLLFERIRGWRTYQTIFFLPYVLPIVVVGAAFRLILRQRGILNYVLKSVGLDFLALNWLGDGRLALFSIMGVMVWHSLGFGIVLFLARMMSVPQELYDAATVDGASWWQRLVHVTVPQLATVIGFYAMTLLIGSFSSIFTYVYEITGGGPADATVVSDYYIYVQAFKYHSMGQATAFSVILFIGIAAITLVQSKMRERLEW